jgi:TonB-dependent starch-binding outer membrane protein SusC
MRTLRVLLAMVLALAIVPAEVLAQTGTVRGRVTEQATGQPLQGVTVSVVGTNQQVVTNQEGRFALANVPAGQRSVRAARIGYATQTRAVTVGAEPVEVAFALTTDVLGLDEIVVIGYGQTERRRAGGGAIASIQAPAVTETAPIATIENVLQGRVPGVNVTQTSGVPGSAISVRVRGASSISAGNEPLYVVDGVPLIRGDFSRIGIGQTQQVDALSNLNPNEIESIEVLKDASAAAIYGSRASNGVVLITTKRGRAGERADIRFQSYVGTQEAWRRPGFLNAQQYVEVYNEAWRNDGLEDWLGPAFAPIGSGEDPFWAEYDPSVDTNWIDEIFQRAPISNLFGSIAGGTERARYYVSGTRFFQDGIVSGYGFERMNGRVNLDYTATDRLTFGTSVALTRGEIQRARGDNTIYGPFANAIASAPIDRVFNEDGSYNLTTLAYDNPVALNRENRAQERSYHVLGNLFADYRFLPGVTGRANFGLDQYILRGYLYDSPVVGPATASLGQGEIGNSYVNKYLVEGTVNFQRDLAADHFISGVVGTAYEQNHHEANDVQGTQFPTTHFRQLASASTIIGGTSFITEYNLLSAFGRLQHTWRDRVTTTFNVRTDGSSRFGAANRWGTFPSASILYRIGDEEFFRQQPVFSDLALRASYGRTGNQEGLGNFASRALFGGGFNYGDRPGIAPTQMENPNLRWEKTDQLNLGGDAAFLGDRLSLSFDWYRKNTSDLLLNRPIPLSSGFGVIAENIGAMRNTGEELSLRAHVIQPARAEGFRWTSELNLSRNRNVVTRLYGDEPISGNFVARVEVGQPLGFFYGYIMDGIFRSEDEICYDSPAECAARGMAFQSDWTMPGDVRFRDLNGDGQITADDRGYMGSPWPDYQGGWTNTLSFAGLDLTVFTQFSQGGQIYNGMREYTDAFGAYLDNNTVAALDRWTPENPDAAHPRATFFDDNFNARSSSRFVEDGSYVRIKNAVLGYNIPTRFANRAGFQSMRVYVQGQNLHTWTNYSGFDPEVNFNGPANITRGIDFYTLPQARTYTVGLNVGF